MNQIKNLAVQVNPSARESQQGDWPYNSAVWSGEEIEQFSKLIIGRCVDLITAHAANMEQYNFEDKARTARSCAGMILEHFEMKEKQ